MGLDELHLRVLATSSDDPQERKNAQKGSHYHLVIISWLNSFPVLRLLTHRRHWVLVVCYRVLHFVENCEFT